MRATYRPTPDAPEVPCEVIEVYARTVVCREVDKLWPGVFIATKGQVLVEKIGSRWYGTALEALRRDYETSLHTLAEIADRHRTHAGVVTKLAAKHKWQRFWMRRGRVGRRPIPVAHQVA